MQLSELIKDIANLLKEFDSTKPVHKNFKPGIGPFGEPQLVKIISDSLIKENIQARTRRTPDLEIQKDWAIEFKIVRPYGDNGKEAENWTVNLLHPYPGNVSLIGDALKLLSVPNYKHKGLIIIGYEHDPVKITIDPLIYSFELIAQNVVNIKLGKRIEEKRKGLIHPEHQVVRCIGWELHN